MKSFQATAMAGFLNGFVGVLGASSSYSSSSLSSSTYASNSSNSSMSSTSISSTISTSSSSSSVSVSSSTSTSNNDASASSTAQESVSLTPADPSSTLPTTPSASASTVTVVPVSTEMATSHSGGEEYISSKTYTTLVTFDVAAGKTETYYSNNHYAEGPSLTMTGPFTTTITQVITTPVIAGKNDTQTSLPAWNPDWFRTNCGNFQESPVTTTSMNASVSSRCESFISYGRGTQCSADWSSFTATAPTSTFTDGIDVITSTLPNGDTTNVINYATFTEQPFAADGHCCWYCSLYYTNLELFYWPATDANTDCLATQSPAATQAANSSAPARVNAPAVTEAYATDADGFVYTSPSVYVKFPTIRGEDECGQVGPLETHLTLAFAPGELSTVVGGGPGPGTATTVQFDPRDMPCGPNNGSNGFLPQFSTGVTGYLPIIARPSKLTSLRPDWARCTNDYWEGQDPPQALTAQPGLLAPTGNEGGDGPTTTSVEAQPESTPATPASTPEKQPESTGGAGGGFSPHSATLADPPKSQPSSSPVEGSDPPKTSDEPPAQGDPGSPSDDSSSSPADPTQSQPSDPQNTQPAGDPSNNTPSDPSDSKPSSDPGNDQSNDPPSDSDSDPSNNAPSQQSSDGDSFTAGGFTFSRDTSSPDPTPGSDSSPESVAPVVAPTPITIGSETITPIPSSSAIEFDGQTITAGQPPTTINGHTVAFSNNNVVVDGSTAALPTPAPSPATSGISNPDQPSPTPLLIAGTTLHPGGPAITISGTTLSLDPSSALIVDGSTIPVPTPTPNTNPANAPNSVVIAGETVDLASSDIVVGGTTLTPGAPGITVDGQRVSLGSSGLVVGTSTVPFEAGATGTEGIGDAIWGGLGGSMGTGAATGTATGGKVRETGVGESGGGGGDIAVGEAGKRSVGFGVVVLAVLWAVVGG